MTVFFCYLVILWNWAGICNVLSQNKKNTYYLDVFFFFNFILFLNFT